ncbi:MAG: type I phosphomannose isomerase catalytic subunit [Chthoniobacterales bacterium]
MPSPTASRFSEPLTFTPLFKERIWGGRRLETLFGKQLPPSVRIGESWEIVDRPEAQSVVRAGAWSGQTLHHLWLHHRPEVFGEMADAPRFPLFLKLLDAAEKLSVQVHPPAEVAAQLGSEPKTECWYVAHAVPDAELYVGLKNGCTRAAFEAALEKGTVAEHIHRIPVRTGDAMFLPSGRVHAIGAGNVLVEVQQNSDTTYRVFDWNRSGDDGAPRALHIAESLSSIDFDDYEPALVRSRGDSLLEDPLFAIERSELTAAREVAPAGRFAIVVCLTGKILCAGLEAGPGEFFLVPASLTDRLLQPRAPQTTFLRVTAGR